MSVSMKNSRASKKTQLARRSFLAYFSGLGLSATVLPGVLWAKMQDDEVTSITFTGKLYGESEVLTVAKAYQDVTGFHLKHPVL